MTKVIIFDLGGVLIDLDIKSCIDACRNDIGCEEAARLLDPCHQKGIFQRLERGDISRDEFSREILSMCRPGTTEDEVAKAFGKLLVGIEPYKVELLKELSKHFDLYLLSNNNALTMPQSWDMFDRLGIPMGTIFKKQFLSYEMHMLKPGDEIYRAAIRDISSLSCPVSPDEMLFIDDSPINVEAAIRNGMRSICCPQGADLRKLLTEALS
mgnify:FL=1